MTKYSSRTLVQDQHGYQGKIVGERGPFLISDQPGGDAKKFADMLTMCILVPVNSSVEINQETR